MENSPELQKKRMRLTVIILLGIMLMSGIFVTIAYRQTLQAQAQEGRPPIIHGIRDQFAAVDQNGKFYNTGDLMGKVWLVAAFSTEQASQSRESIDAMKRIHAANAECEFVLITVNPKVDTPEKMRVFARENGLEGARWHLLAAEKGRDYLRARIQFTNPHEPPTAKEMAEGWRGVWFDTRLAAVDKKHHVRGFVEPGRGSELFLDFKTNKAQEPQKLLSFLDQKLAQQVTYLQNEKEPEKKKFTSLFVAGAVIFTLIAVILAKRQQTGS